VPADQDVAHAFFVQALEQVQQGIRVGGHRTLTLALNLGRIEAPRDFEGVTLVQPIQLGVGGAKNAVVIG